MATIPAAAGTPALSEAERRFAQAKQYALWRRRLLPIVGGLVLLAIWGGVVYVFEVRRFIAPSPLLVVQTLHDKFGMMMTNLVPTAIEAVSGFVLGNLVAIVIATV